MRRRGRFGFAGALCALSAAAAAPAEPAAVVEFSGSGADCPDARYVDQRFWDLVGAGTRTPGKAAVVASRRDDGTYEFVIRIRVGEERGERRFTAASCTLGAETAALIVAISLFPERANDLEQRARGVARDAASSPAGGSSESSEAEARKASSGSSPPDPLLAEHPGKRERSWTLRGRASLNAGLDTTSMPAAAAGFGVGVGLELERLLIELVALQFVPQTLELPEQRGARFALQSLGLHLCYAFLSADVTAHACVGATGLRQTGEGFGAQRNYERVALYGGPALGSALRVPFTSYLELRIYAESFLSLQKPRFLLEDRVVHRTLSVGLAACIGPELRF